MNGKREREDCLGRTSCPASERSLSRFFAAFRDFRDPALYGLNLSTHICTGVCRQGFSLPGWENIS